MHNTIYTISSITPTARTILKDVGGIINEDENGLRIVIPSARLIHVQNNHGQSWKIIILDNGSILKLHMQSMCVIAVLDEFYT